MADKLSPRMIADATYLTYTGAKTILASERGYFLHKTGGAATWALQAAATMGEGWHTTIRVDDSQLTIDPQGAETIDGAATVVIPPGYTVDLICNGSAFFTSLRRNAWLDLGTYDGAGLSSLPLSNLSVFRRLRIGGFLRPSTDDVNLLLRTSTNNGASFDEGAADYLTQHTLANSTSLTGAQATRAAIFLENAGVGNAADEGIQFSVLIDNFNQSLNAFFTGEASLLTAAGGFRGCHTYGLRLSATSRNAVQIRFSAGTIAEGKVTFEGMA